MIYGLWWEKSQRTLKNSDQDIKRRHEIRGVVGILEVGDFPQGRWAYNLFLCDDAYDAASQEENLLIVDAHGWEDPSKGWVMELVDGVFSVEEWVGEQPEEKVFLNVCSPGAVMITPRQGQTVIFSLSIARAGSDRVQIKG